MNLNKPQGVTSFAMVSLVKRLTGVRRVGHAGTLDPLATGVLPILLGQGTRLMEFISSQGKSYLARIELGSATDTGDSQGRVVSRGDCSTVTPEQLESALLSFVGTIQQVPPMFSALKRGGEPLYRLARQGISVPRKSRTAHISGLRLLEWQPPALTVKIDCSKGTYVRTIATDLGEKLGCGAHLSGLTRLRSSFLSIEDAITPEELELAVDAGCWHEMVYPMDEALLDLAAIIVGNTGEQDIRAGKTFDRQKALHGEPDAWCRAYSVSGDLIGLLRFQPDSAAWHPERVFPAQTTCTKPTT